jgi:flagellar basal body-associated protein FliL
MSKDNNMDRKRIVIIIVTIAIVTLAIYLLTRIVSKATPISPTPSQTPTPNPISPTPSQTPTPNPTASITINY